MNMPKRMQVLKLQDELRKTGISADLVDLDALVDASLTYPENYRNIIGRYKRVDNKVQKSRPTTFGISNVNFSYAAQFHQARTPQAQRTDEATRAKRTYTERQVMSKPERMDRWFRNPGRSDIIGIDAFGRSKPRKRR